MGIFTEKKNKQKQKSEKKKKAETKTLKTSLYLGHTWWRDRVVNTRTAQRTASQDTEARRGEEE